MTVNHCRPGCTCCACSEPDCGDPPHALRLCLRHYQRHQYWRDPERARAKNRAAYARRKARRGEAA